MARLENFSLEKSSKPTKNFNYFLKNYYIKPKIRHFSCLFFFIIFFLVILLLNSSGLIKLPLIKDIVYRKEPSPIRYVEIKEPLSYSLLEEISNFRANSSLREFKISEEVLTQAARWEWKGLPLEDPQIVILPGELELFSLVLKPRPFYLTVRAQIIPLNGKTWGIKVKTFKVGHLKIPHFIANFLSVVFIEKFLNHYITAAGYLTDIKLEDRYMVLIK